VNYAPLKSLLRIKALVALCALSILLIPSAFAQGQQDFTLVNDTGVTINQVFISPHTTNDWEEDILGQDILADGESLEIHFSRTEKAAKWDLKVTDKEDNSITWTNLNLLEISKLTLHYENGRAWADVE
jgi:hypothetical protein